MTSIAGILVISMIGKGIGGVVEGEQSGLVDSAVNVFGSLIIVLAILVIGLYWGKRFIKIEQEGGGKTVRVLGSTYLGMKKSISLVEIPGSILVLGLSNENITLLSTIKDNDMEKVVKSHEEKPKNPVCPEWIHPFRVFSPSKPTGETKATRPVISFVKGKILDFKRTRQIHIRTARVHPIPVGKNDYE